MDANTNIEQVLSSGAVSRRTVNRGLAWSVPVVAAAFAAPAATASNGPSATYLSGTGMKTTGNPKYVDFTLYFDVAAPGTILITSVSGDVWNSDYDTLPVTRTVAPGSAVPVTFRLGRGNNSSITVQASFTVQQTGGGSPWSATQAVVIS